MYVKAFFQLSEVEANLYNFLSIPNFPNNSIPHLVRRYIKQLNLPDTLLNEVRKVIEASNLEYTR